MFISGGFREKRITWLPVFWFVVSCAFVLLSTLLLVFGAKSSSGTLGLGLLAIAAIFSLIGAARTRRIQVKDHEINLRRGFWDRDTVPLQGTNIGIGHKNTGKDHVVLLHLDTGGSVEILRTTAFGWSRTRKIAEKIAETTGIPCRIAKGYHQAEEVERRSWAKGRKIILVLAIPLLLWVLFGLLFESNTSHSALLKMSCNPPVHLHVDGHDYGMVGTSTLKLSMGEHVIRWLVPNSDHWIEKTLVLDSNGEFRCEIE